MVFSKFYSLIVAAFFLISGAETAIYAQSPPAVSPGDWLLNLSLSDEFNDSVIDQSKWRPLDPCVYTDSIRHGFNGGQGAFFELQNTYLDSGNLVIKVDYNPDSLNLAYPCFHQNVYPFISGGVESISRDAGPGVGVVGNYSFGYYEMRAKLPGYYNAANQPVGYGFFPTFWFAYFYAEGSCIKAHDEVDILEPSASQYYDARANVVGWHDEDGHCSTIKTGQDSVRCATPFFEDYHKFAVALLPEKIAFYLDDKLFYSADTVSAPSIVHSLNMAPYQYVIIQLQMGGYQGHTPYPYSDAPFPEYMYVDYFRYYKLNPDFYHYGNELYQNFPNPFTGVTEIAYSTDIHSSNAVINIYNMLGMQVKSIPLQEKGKSKITLHEKELPSGIYLYSLTVDDKVVATRKLVVM